jgi:hypothetical protein
MGYNADGELGDGTYSNANRPEQIVASASLTLTRITLAGTNLVLTGINGVSGATNYVLMTTNVALPKTQWLPLATNVLISSGSFTITVTNAVDRTARQRFYTLKLQ